MALSKLAWVLLFMTTGILAAKALTMPFAMVPVPITQIFITVGFINGLDNDYSLVKWASVLVRKAVMPAFWSLVAKHLPNILFSKAMASSAARSYSSLMHSLA